MAIRVKITIKGIQKPANDDPVASEFVTYGKLSKYGSKIRVSYEESEMFGTPGVTTAFIVDDSALSMERSGKLNAKMFFEEGSKTECMYNTEYGTFLMGITAKKVSAEMTDNGGTISVEYGIELEHQHVGNNVFDIIVENAEDDTDSSIS